MKKIIYLEASLITGISSKEEAKKEVAKDTIPQETETSTVKNTEYPENVNWGDMMS